MKRQRLNPAGNRLSILLLLLLFGITQKVLAQCPGAFSCEAANTICGAQFLNGFTCQNPASSNTDFPHPSLCRGVGVPTNLMWWNFAGNGQPLTINFSFDLALCQKNLGIQAGVFERHCDGAIVWDCNANCNTSSFTLSGPSTKCTNYLLWVNGCDKDICNYAMTVVGGAPPRLPRPMPPISVVGQAFPCSIVQVCLEDYNGGCEPTLNWTIDGIPSSNTECTEVEIPENLPMGVPIKVCVTATIGNPNDPQSICDQDMSCIDVFPLPALTHLGQPQSICFEDQPFNWHGNLIVSSCVTPPCTARVNLGPYCVDSVKSLIFLPQRRHGYKEIMVCGPPPTFPPIITEDRRLWKDDVCGEIIEFQDNFYNCDTTYDFNLRVFKYKSNLSSGCNNCSGHSEICSDITYDPSCPEFNDGQVLIILEWHEEGSSKIVHISNGVSCFTPQKSGTYCYDMKVYFANDTCLFPDEECIDFVLDTSSLSPFLEQTCRGLDSSVFILNAGDTLCQVDWQFSGGSVVSQSQSGDTVSVFWQSGKPDSVVLCVDFKTDCTTDTLCQTFHLIEKRIGNPLHLCSNQLPFNWNGVTIDKEGTYTARLNLNGCVVDSILDVIVSTGSIDIVIDTTICVFDKDTHFYVDPRGAIWPTSVDSAIVDLGGFNICDSLAYISVDYISGAILGSIDTVICGYEGDQLSFTDASGTVWTNPVDSILFDVGNQDPCDSNYYLSVDFLTVGFDWDYECDCDTDGILLNPNIRTFPLDANADYYWINSSGDTLSRNDRLTVFTEDDYCLHIYLDIDGNQCHSPFIICDPFDENSFFGKYNILGRLVADSKPNVYTLRHRNARLCEVLWITNPSIKYSTLSGRNTSIGIDLTEYTGWKIDICALSRSECSGWDTTCIEVKLKDQFENIEDLFKFDTLTHDPGSFLKVKKNELNIDIFPNPFEASIKIKSSENADFIIFNSMHQKILNGQIKSASELIDLSSFNSGIYFIVFKNETEFIVRRVIKR